MGKVVDPTQRTAGDDEDWVKEPYDERHADLIPHTERPFNAEPPNYALRTMITPKGLHYRRQHTPVPLVDPEEYRVNIGFEDSELKQFSLSELQESYEEKELVVTFMCTGNRRSEFNTPKDGETMGLPWKNGSISTARWSGCSLTEVLKASGVDPFSVEDDGYNFLTFYGLEGYHVSIPIHKALQRNNDCLLAWKMNGEVLPRDHGFPLRVIIPGYVGARSVKWIHRIIITKNQADGMHQRGIAYKQLAPNHKKLSAVTKEYIESLPPIDQVPVTSAVTAPEPISSVRPGSTLNLCGYAYSGSGLAIIRVDVSIDGGETWDQATLERAPESQGIRSGRAWAWVQWRLSTTVPEDATGSFKVVCKAIDDQYNQQPHDPSPIWNLRGILNNSWGNVELKVVSEAGSIEEAVLPFLRASSGDGSIDNVGIKVNGTYQCPDCRQKFDSEHAAAFHWKFIHDPNRQQED
jgi:sulfite oxidase